MNLLLASQLVIASPEIIKKPSISSQAITTRARMDYSGLRLEVRKRVPLELGEKVTAEYRASYLISSNLLLYATYQESFNPTTRVFFVLKF